MNFDIYEINKYVAASDTDSLFVCFEKVISKHYPDLDLNSKEDCLPITKKLQTDLRPILNDYQNVLAKDILNIEDHYFDLKPEFILQSAYWSGKRRYAQLAVDKEGKSIEKLIVMGLDIMKSNFPEYFRGFGEKLIRKLLVNTGKKEIDQFIIDFRDSINVVDWKKLTKPTGLKKIKEYLESPPPPGKIFSSLGKKCPINTKSSIRYNDLLKFNNWGVEYPQIQIGDKVYIIYLKKNPYRIDSIAIKGYDDPPELIEFIEEFIDKDKLFEAVIQKKIEKIYQDMNYGAVVFNSIISDYFAFE